MKLMEHIGRTSGEKEGSILHISKIITGTLLLVLMAFSCFSVDAASITKTLNETTRIMPSGVMAAKLKEIPEFKGGTTVVLNERGEVLEGTLAADTPLACVGGAPFYYIYYHSGYSGMQPSRVHMFMAGTRVYFNAKGEVVRGTIIGDSVTTPISQTSYIRVHHNDEISFHENGILATCTLYSDTYLRPIGWQQNQTLNHTDKVLSSVLIEFRKETYLELNDKGEVTKGTLNNNTKLVSPGGVIKVYEAGTTVEFDNNGVVVKAIKP